MFYELNSLIKVPIEDPTDSETTMKEPFYYSIQILTSTFTRFSTCGAIFSNQFGYVPEVTVLHPEYDLSFQLYFTYSVTAKLNELKRTAIESTTVSASTHLPVFQFIGNTVSEFNYLKNNSDLLSDDNSRNQPYMPEVYSDQLRDRGLILELYGNFSGGTIEIRDNIITDMQSFIYDSEIAFS